MIRQYHSLLWLVFLFSLPAIEEVFAQTDFWQATSGPNGGRIYDIAISQTGIIFAGTDSGAFRSSDEGNSWVRINNGIPTMYGMEITSLAISSSGTILVLMPNHGLYRSTNNGDSWQFVFWPYHPVAIVVDSASDFIFVGTCEDGGIPECRGCHHGYLYRSTDGGQTWTSIDSLGSVSILGTNESGSVFAYGHTEWCCYQHCYGSGRLFQTTDGGMSWTVSWEHTYSCGPACALASAMTFDLSGDVFFGSADSAFRSSDNGISWSWLGSLPSRITDFITDAGSNLFTATNGSGVFRNFLQINSGLTNLNVLSLAIGPNRHIFAGTSGSGIFRSVQPTVGIPEPPNEVPSSFRLDQNYPNPFNPSTTIKYQIPTQTHVTLKVFDVLGREIAALVNGVEEPGYKSVRFDAFNLSSGVYYYRIQAGNYIETKKLLLLR